VLLALISLRRKEDRPKLNGDPRHEVYIGDAERKESIVEFRDK